MFSHNLLDPNFRNKLVKERITILIKEVTLLSFFVVTIIACSLVASKMLLIKDLRETAIRTNVIASHNRPITQAIHELNINLQAVDLMIDEHTKWSEWLDSFSHTVPAGNQLISMNIDRESRTISMTGRSKRRSDLLNFKENLENSDLVDEITLPLSNLLSRENIEFEMSAIINTSSLIRSESSSIE